MRLLVTPTFSRALKKLHSGDKAALDEAVRQISNNPRIGEAKLGDLEGVHVFKFRLNNQLCLLAYSQINESAIKLLAFGSHENFYRDLKR
jgi:mRNA interferase RelE/StbE